MLTVRKANRIHGFAYGVRLATHLGEMAEWLKALVC